MLRCDSSGDLYTFPPAIHTNHVYTTASDLATLWHARLGHLSCVVIASLQQLAPCNKVATRV